MNRKVLIISQIRILNLGEPIHIKIVILQHFGYLIFLAFRILQIQDSTIQFLNHKLVMIIAFIGQIVYRVLISWLVVHVEYQMCFWDRDDIRDVSRSGSDTASTYWDMHV